MSNNTLTQNAYNLGYRAGRFLADRTAGGTCSSSAFLDSALVEGLPSLSQLLSYVHQIEEWPQRYKSWWINLVTEDPVHVIIETVLICFVLYMILWRRASTWKKDMREKLSEEEKEDLIREWKDKERAGLVPSRSNTSNGNGTSTIVPDQAARFGSGAVVEKVHGAYLTLRLPSAENDGKMEEECRTVLNFATHDFLGMASSDDDNDNDDDGSRDDGAKEADKAPPAPAGGETQPQSVKGAARSALNRYGCGSCGPRGFYGTIDAHLHLESAISKFVGTESAIMYSDGASASTSTIAAFAKRGDLLVVDEAIYEALGTGVTLSRANVKYFRHNDMADLRRVLERIHATDVRLKRRSADQRRFIIVEGLYKNRGTVAPLDELVKLKSEFYYRLIVDESFSFGTLGPNGKGAVEHYGLTPMVDVEIIAISLENALGSIGGVCVGNEEVVDHQRLSGAGYCFSASAPPFVAEAAIASLGQMEHRPELLERLRVNRETIYRELEGGDAIQGAVPEHLVIASDDLSALVFLELSPPTCDGMSRDEQVTILDSIADRCVRKGVVIVSTGRHVVGHLHNVPPPALRMTVSTCHTEEDIQKALRVLKDSVLEVFGET